MKKKILLCFAMFFCIFSVFAKVGDKMYVSVEEAELKDGTSFFSKKIGSLLYGDEVIVLQEKGKWKEIQLAKNSSISGWVNTSSLTKKKIVVSDSRVSASAEELALAGKGFNAEIEEEYKKQGNVNYEAVDKLEKNRIEFTRVLDFMRAGCLIIQQEEE